MRLSLHFKVLFKTQIPKKNPNNQTPKTIPESLSGKNPPTCETCEGAGFHQKFFLKPGWGIVPSLNSWNLNSCRLERFLAMLMWGEWKLLCLRGTHSLCISSIYINILHCIKKILFLNTLLSVLRVSHDKDIVGLTECWSTVYNWIQNTGSMSMEKC